MALPPALFDPAAARLRWSSMLVDELKVLLKTRFKVTIDPKAKKLELILHSVAADARHFYHAFPTESLLTELDRLGVDSGRAASHDDLVSLMVEVTCYSDFAMHYGRMTCTQLKEEIVLRGLPLRGLRKLKWEYVNKLIAHDTRSTAAFEDPTSTTCIHTTPPRALVSQVRPESFPAARVPFNGPTAVPVPSSTTPSVHVPPSKPCQRNSTPLKHSAALDNDPSIHGFTAAHTSTRAAGLPAPVAPPPLPTAPPPAWQAPLAPNPHTQGHQSAAGEAATSPTLKSVGGVSSTPSAAGSALRAGSTLSQPLSRPSTPLISSMPADPASPISRPDQNCPAPGSMEDFMQNMVTEWQSCSYEDLLVMWKTVEGNRATRGDEWTEEEDFGRNTLWELIESKRPAALGEFALAAPGPPRESGLIAKGLRFVSSFSTGSQEKNEVYVKSQHPFTAMIGEVIADDQTDSTMSTHQSPAPRESARAGESSSQNISHVTPPIPARHDTSSLREDQAATRRPDNKPPQPDVGPGANHDARSVIQATSAAPQTQPASHPSAETAGDVQGTVRAVNTQQTDKDTKQTPLETSEVTMTWSDDEVEQMFQLLALKNSHHRSYIKRHFDGDMTELAGQIERICSTEPRPNPASLQLEPDERMGRGGFPDQWHVDTSKPTKVWNTLKKKLDLNKKG